MILPQTNMQAFILMFVSLVCLGSWAVTLKMTGKWRFELYYLDFAFGALVATVIYVSTLGSLGFDGFSFLDDFLHAGKRYWVFAFCAGAVFNLANMLLVGAITVAGMSVAYTVGAGFGLLLGFGLGEMIRREGHPLFLFLGFLMMLAAMVIAAIIHSASMAVKAQAILKEAQQTKKKHVSVPSAVKGLILAAAAGLLMAGYLPLLARSRQLDLGLGPYAGMFMFSVGMFVSTLIFTVFFANLPVEGEPVELTEYFKGSGKTHLIGIGGGMLWCTGMLAAMIATASESPSQAGTTARAAFTYGVPLAGAAWGVLAWGEFHGSPGRIVTLSYVMLLVLAVGVALVSLAPMFLKTT